MIKIKPFDNSGGFTLIEIIMVIVLLGVVGTGILMYFAGLGASKDPVISAAGSILAEEEMEKIFADRKANGFSTIDNIAPSVMPAPFGRFTKEVQVFCVQESDLDASSGAMPNCADTQFRAKRVKIIVSWAGGAVDMVSVITGR